MTPSRDRVAVDPSSLSPSPSSQSQSQSSYRSVVNGINYSNYNVCITARSIETDNSIKTNLHTHTKPILQGWERETLHTLPDAYYAPCGGGLGWQMRRWIIYVFKSHRSTWSYSARRWRRRINIFKRDFRRIVLVRNNDTGRTPFGCFLKRSSRQLLLTTTTKKITEHLGKKKRCTIGIRIVFAFFTIFPIKTVRVFGKKTRFKVPW